MTMTNYTMGVGSIQLYPRGACNCCGYSEIFDGGQVQKLFIYSIIDVFIVDIEYNISL